MTPLRIFIVDDNFVARRGLGSTLNAQNGLVVVGEASTGTEALMSLPKTDTDVVLMDIRMAGLDGIKTTIEIKRLMPGIKVLVLTVVDDPIILAHALNAGATGYLVYGHFTPESLVAAIKTICAGGTANTPPLKDLFPAMDTDLIQGLTATHMLTAREQDVLKMIATGCENREIARALNIEEKTVKNHINSIYSKLHITNRQQAVLFALNARVRS